MSVSHSDADIATVNSFLDLAREMAIKRFGTDNSAVVASLAQTIAIVASGNAICRSNSRTVDTLEQLLLKGEN